MKVVVTSTGPDLDSQLDERYGRASYLLSVDTESMEFAAHDNSANMKAMQGAGVSTSQSVMDMEPDAVITGSLGPKAFAVMQNTGIPSYSAKGVTCREAVQMLLEDKLQRIDNAGGNKKW
ncbi:MAG: NifB/NifX family molybdenum-iron cluster-binding protein [Planctomycetota bacterium]|nr:NifB/NifX family molybdenum-iron cluster-binding protein [Planctomycetota bacterium]